VAINYATAVTMIRVARLASRTAIHIGCSAVQLPGAVWILPKAVGGMYAGLATGL